MKELFELIVLWIVWVSSLSWALGCPRGCKCVVSESQQRPMVSCMGMKYFPEDFPEQTSSLEVQLIGFPGINKYVFYPYKTNAYIPGTFTLDAVIVGGEIGTIHTGAFSYLKSANPEASLSFHNASIHVIEREAFSKLNEFRVISFENSTITKIKDRSFSDISKLGSLLFKSVRIHETNQYAFCGFEHVREISFTDVAIDSNQGALFTGLIEVHLISFKSMVVNLTSSVTDRSSNFKKPFFAVIIGGNDATFLFNETSIPAMPANSFYGIVQFRNFLIENSSIGHIGSDAFTNFDCVHTFSITSSSIQTIDEHAFNSWTGVRSFSIPDSTVISKAANEIFFNFNNVYIDLSSETDSPTPLSPSVNRIYKEVEPGNHRWTDVDSVDLSHCLVVQESTNDSDDLSTPWLTEVNTTSTASSESWLTPSTLQINDSSTVEDESDDCQSDFTTSQQTQEQPTSGETVELPATLSMTKSPADEFPATTSLTRPSTDELSASSTGPPTAKFRITPRILASITRLPIPDLTAAPKYISKQTSGPVTTSPPLQASGVGRSADQTTEASGSKVDNLPLYIGVSLAGGAVLVAVIIVACVCRSSHGACNPGNAYLPNMAQAHQKISGKNHTGTEVAVTRMLGVDNPSFRAPRGSPTPQSAGRLSLGDREGPLPPPSGHRKADVASEHPDITDCDNEGNRQARFLTLIEVGPVGINSKHKDNQSYLEIDETKETIVDSNRNQIMHSQKVPC